jgi:transcriptional regulator with XRE-family HTH domain
MERYLVLVDRQGEPLVIVRTLWLFSPARAETLRQELGCAFSEPLGIEEGLRLGMRLNATFVCVAPDDAPLSTLSPDTPDVAPDAWTFDARLGIYTQGLGGGWPKPPAGAARKRLKIPPRKPDRDADAIALMTAPSSQFTAGPRETAPEEYAASGELLREQREKAGLSQGALAEKSGVDVRIIERLEAEHTKPHSKTVRLLAKALGIPRAALLGVEFDEGVKVENEVSFDPELVDRNVWEQRGNVWREEE